MITYGAISPHPPIILPSIGSKDDLKLVKKTINALERTGENLAKEKPDEIVIISPHPEHGFYVPLYYLGKKMPKKTKISKILVTNPSYQYYFDKGRKLAEKQKNNQKNIAVISSGDLSHVLKEDGPYGFNPAGPKLDKIIIEAVKNNDPEKLLKINPEILEEGAECGLRSILFLMGTIPKAKTKILSYEGPFGVGYLVAEFKKSI